MKTIHLIIYVLCGILALSVIFLLFSYAYTSYESFSAQSTQSRLEEVLSDEKILAGEFAEWNDMNNIYTKFKSDYLVDAADYRKFKQELPMTLRKNGLQVTAEPKFTPEKRAKFTDVSKISVNIQVTGAYDGMKRFIHEIANKKRMILFKNVKLEKQAGSSLSGSFSMEVYFDM